MTKKTITSALPHRVPKDMKMILESHKDVLDVWNTLTHIALNEWICWVTIVKKEETRAKHLTRLCEDLLKGRRRPCCWPGCPHRKPSAQKWFAKK